MLTVHEDSAYYWRGNFLSYKNDCDTQIDLDIMTECALLVEESGLDPTIKPGKIMFHSLLSEKTTNGYEQVNGGCLVHICRLWRGHAKQAE